MTSPRPCTLCSTLTAEDVTELDALLSDPKRWPKTVFTLFKPPAGTLPASYRRYGAIEMGMTWLSEHGYPELSVGMLRRHYRFDVPLTSIDTETLAARGLIETGNPARATDVAALDAMAFVRLYDKGVKLGVRAVEILHKRLDDMVARGEEPSLEMLEIAANYGIKLAISQAGFRATGKGRDFGDAADDDDAFRGDDSPRYGHQRIRQIDGEDRPVTDQGPADRQDFNKRARKEGSATLPAP